MFFRKNIAIIYDWIDKWGGVERVLLTLYEMFPGADFYTSYFDIEKASWAKNFKIKTSFVQKLPTLAKRNRIVSLPFYPFAFESIDFTSYDLVISVSPSFAKGIITKPKTTHICYLLTPSRYLWSHYDVYFQNQWIKKIFSVYINYLRRWDFVAAHRPDKIISISKTVAERCQKYYRRSSQIIYPPFDIEFWKKISLKIEDEKSKIKLKFKNYYLIVSRLEPYKRVDLVIKVFNKIASFRQRSEKDKAEYNLVIVGEGTEKKRLEKMAGRNILFLSKLTDKELGVLYSNTQALIMPQEEDFGYVALEAQFFGCPVIAYKKGGSKETIIDGKTGIFFDEQKEESLVKTLARFKTISYNLRTKVKYWGARNIEKFEKNKFIKKFLNAVNDFHDFHQL